MNAFLRGEYTMDEEFQALVAKGKKTQEEVDSMIQLANEVQYSILTKKLVPGASWVIPRRRLMLSLLLRSDADVL